MDIGDVNHDELWFWQSGDDLRVGIRDTQDWFTIDDWYVSASSKIERCSSVDDNFTLLESQVQQLVQAMAVFDVQAAANLNVSQQQVDSVQSVIAAAWAVG